MDRGTKNGLAVLLFAVLGYAGFAQVTESNDIRRLPRRAAAAEPEQKDSAASGTAADDARQPVKTRYDSMVYRKDGVIEFKGNVIIQRGSQELRADYVIYNRETEEADAYGNVVMKRGAEVWRGERLHYNFKQGVGSSDSMSYSAAPFALKASHLERLPENRFRAKSARVTTCSKEFDHPHFTVRAKEIVLSPGESIRGKHTVFFLGKVPFFYLPFWFRDLDESTGWRFRAGYRSNWGAYLLSSYRYPVGEVVRGETHLDYRTDRGIAVGQDFGWGTESSQGYVELYYVNDDEPLDEDDDPDKDIDSARYRFKVKNTSTISERERLYLQAEYVSDVDFREDFFEPEFRENVQPDNYLVYQHRRDNIVGSVLGQFRLNDFYEGVNRTPELSLDVLRQPLGETLLYYESQTDVSNLERVHSEPDSDQDYSALRIDTAHLVNYPGKYLGYLTVIPRFGARGTHYSATKVSTTEDRVVSVLTTNAGTGAVTSSTQTNSVTTVADGAAKLRTRFELGCEVSLKAYRTWAGLGGPRRHVVEPYANYTFVPRPSVEPEELYQFDDADSLDRIHQIQLGVRNKYQKKVDDMPFDIIDLNLYTFLVMDPDEGQDSIQNLYFDGRLQPGRSSIVTFDGFYDTSGSELARFNTRLECGVTRWWQLGAEYHYIADEASLISADATFLPDHAWTWNVFGRYEGEAGRMEEAGGYIQRNLDCLSIRTRASVLPAYEHDDGTEEESEFRVMLEFWLRAFPDMRISARHGG